MSDYPDDWFRKLSMVASRPDLLTGTEMLTVTCLGHTRGPPNTGDAEMVLRVYNHIREREPYDPEKKPWHRP